MIASKLVQPLRQIQHRSINNGRFLSSSAKSALVKVPDAEVTRLSNGVRVASENWNTKTCTIGVWLQGGSRLENDDNNGASQILRYSALAKSESQIGSHGASVGSGVWRDRSAYWVTCFSRDLPWAVKLLADSVQDYQGLQLEKARAAALNELQSAENNLETVVFDYLHASAYQGTPLSLSPLGQTEPLQSLSEKELQQFASARLKPSQLVISAAGAVQHSELADLCSKHFGQLTEAKSDDQQSAGSNIRFTGSTLLDRDDQLPYAHVAIAVEGPPADSIDSVALLLANYYIGGWDKLQGGGNNVASKLARQAHDAFNGGIISYRSFLEHYSDTSLWGMYFVARQESVNCFTKDFQTDWMELSQDVRNFDLTRAKNALLTDIYLKINGTEAACSQLANNILLYDRRIPLSELEDRIMNVTASDIQSVANEYIYDRCPAVAAAGPIEGLPDYNRIRGKMWFYRV